MVSKREQHANSNAPLRSSGLQEGRERDVKEKWLGNMGEV
jgi:hypothetical protein